MNKRCCNDQYLSIHVGGLAPALTTRCGTGCPLLINTHTALPGLSTGWNGHKVFKGQLTRDKILQFQNFIAGL
jgi:hypothetical protein